VLALLIASVFALWLIIRPPDVPGESGSAAGPIETANPTTTGGPTVTIPPSDTPGPSGGATPGPTAVATPTPGSGETPAPTEAPAQTTYVVQEGDTWFGVAAQFGVDPEALAAANGRTLDDFLVVGETIIIP
jgi:LysM repeat protein